MGSSISSVSLWKRELKTDNYSEDPEWVRYRRNDVDPITFQENSMSHFKNHAYRFALLEHPYNKNTKALYLYADTGIHDKLGFRLMKCEFKGSSFVISFRNPDVANIWYNTDEKTEWFNNNVKYFDDFYKKWEYVNEYKSGYIKWGKWFWRRKMNYNNHTITAREHLNNTAAAYSGYEKGII